MDSVGQAGGREADGKSKQEQPAFHKFSLLCAKRYTYQLGFPMVLDHYGKELPSLSKKHQKSCDAGDETHIARAEGMERVDFIQKLWAAP